VAKVFEYGPFRLFRRVVLPGALPSIFTGLRFGLGHCWMLVIGAEFLASTTGIGYMMAWSRTLMQSDVVIVGVLVVGAFGFLMDLLLRQVEYRLLAWRRYTLLS
jgi:sulfonate transport system permease protein